MNWIQPNNPSGTKSCSGPGWLKKRGKYAADTAYVLLRGYVNLDLYIISTETKKSGFHNHTLMPARSVHNTMNSTFLLLGSEALIPVCLRWRL